MVGEVPRLCWSLVEWWSWAFTEPHGQRGILMVRAEWLLGSLLCHSVMMQLLLLLLVLLQLLLLLLLLQLLLLVGSTESTANVAWNSCSELRLDVGRAASDWMIQALNGNGCAHVHMCVEVLIRVAQRRTHSGR